MDLQMATLIVLLIEAGIKNLSLLPTLPNSFLIEFRYEIVI